MKIILSKVLTDLKKEEIKEGDGTVITLGKILANVLASQRSSGNNKIDALRSYMLAVDLYNKQEVDMNEADALFIEQAVKENDIYAPIVTGQVLLLLNEMKKKDE